MYLCKEDPTHLSPKINKYHYKYPYGTDFGGVTMIKREQYEKVNGHTNMFWGWGKEDADMEYRLRLARFAIAKPDPIDVGRYTMFSHIHTGDFQNEKFSVGLEDDHSANLKKSLMAFRGNRAHYDGLNSLAYVLTGLKQNSFHAYVF